MREHNDDDPGVIWRPDPCAPHLYLDGVPVEPLAMKEVTYIEGPMSPNHFAPRATVLAAYLDSLPYSPCPTSTFEGRILSALCTLDAAYTQIVRMFRLRDDYYSGRCHDDPGYALTPQALAYDADTDDVQSDMETLEDAIERMKSLSCLKAPIE